MIDEKKREQAQAEKRKTRQRMRASVDPENYEFYPERKAIDFYDTEIPQRVAVYVRVSTDDIKQTTSFELQQRYYEDYIKSRPNWTLYKIYPDEGISGTSAAHRKGFAQMLEDAKAGRFDLIITKSVSRLARNVVLAISVVRELAELKNPVGVFFESEAIFSLKDESQMALSFIATMAEEESHIRSRSMETSLRMRLDNGIPLTPKLLGYTHDADGNLVINPEEAPTVKLAFYMYLYGYTTQQIADAFNALGRKSYLGNVKWTSGGVLQVLRNERHCGEVLTRKTFTENYRTHRTLKNRGERPQSRYLNHHEAIISRDDFIAVQRMIDNSKYGNRTYLPELRVIDSGLFRGFVIVNPRWAGFGPADYIMAAKSVYDPSDSAEDAPVLQFEVSPGDFDLRGFEVARTEFFDMLRRPYIKLEQKKIKVSSACVQQFGNKCYVELLVNPITRQLAIRPSDKTNRNAVLISKAATGKRTPKDISSAAFGDTLFSLMGWNIQCKYRIIGEQLSQGDEIAFLFDAERAEAFIDTSTLSEMDSDDSSDPAAQPLTSSGNYTRAIPEEWTTSFGQSYYLHEQSSSVMACQSETDWKLRLQGQLFETGKPINVTALEEIRQYIRAELSAVTTQEEHHE